MFLGRRCPMCSEVYETLVEYQELPLDGTLEVQWGFTHIDTGRNMTMLAKREIRVCRCGQFRFAYTDEKDCQIKSVEFSDAPRTYSGSIREIECGSSLEGC